MMMMMLIVLMMMMLILHDDDGGAPKCSSQVVTLLLLLLDKRVGHLYHPDHHWHQNYWQRSFKLVMVESPAFGKLSSKI